MTAGFPAHAHRNMTAQLLAFLHICAVAWLHRGLKQNPKDFSKHFPRGFFLGGNTRLGGWAFEILSGKCSMLSFKDVQLIHQGSLSHLMYRPGPCELSVFFIFTKILWLLLIILTLLLCSVSGFLMRWAWVYTSLVSLFSCLSLSTFCSFLFIRLDIVFALTHRR